MRIGLNWLFVGGLLLAVAGCSKAKPDLLREFAEPYELQRAVSAGVVFHLELEAGSQAQLSSGTTSLRFEPSRAELSWTSGQVFPLSGELEFLVRPVESGPALLAQAWSAAYKDGQPAPVRFRILTQYTETPSALDLSDPRRQSAPLTLRGQLESHGFSSELELKTTLELERANPDSGARRVNVRCAPTSRVDSLRYGVRIPLSSAGERAATGLKLGCALSFRARSQSNP